MERRAGFLCGFMVDTLTEESMLQGLPPQQEFLVLFVDFIKKYFFFFLRKKARIPQIMGSQKTHLKFCERVNVTLESCENPISLFLEHSVQVNELESRGIFQDRQLVFEREKTDKEKEEEEVSKREEGEKEREREGEKEQREEEREEENHSKKEREGDEKEKVRKKKEEKGEEELQKCHFLKVHSMLLAPTSSDALTPETRGLCLCPHYPTETPPAHLFKDSLSANPAASFWCSWKTN